MIKHTAYCLMLAASISGAFANQTKANETIPSHTLTIMAKKAIDACEDEKSKACTTWKVEFHKFVIKQTNLTTHDFINVAEQVYESPHFSYLGKIFFLEQAEQIYFNAIKQHHIDYLKQPDPDALPGVNQTYRQSLKDLQYAEKHKSRYIETMCAPIRTVWAGGSGMDGAYAECKSEFIGFNLKFLINTWNEMKTQ